MNPFQYATAHNPDEAISLMGQEGRLLGGGIDLLDEMKAYIVSPKILVTVKGLGGPGIKQGSTAGSEGAKSGSAAFIINGETTVADIASHQDLQKALPGLSAAASEVGSPQIRNVATLAGNLLQHSRCWYYRQPDVTCLKRGGSTCYAHEGENKYHSLFSGNPCVSPVVSNLATMLTALEATVSFRQQDKNVTLPIADVYKEAWINPSVSHSMKPQDFLLTVTVPLHRTHSAYRQLSEKSEFDWALVSCAAAGNVKNGKITSARVVLGSVAPVPYMVEEANKFLEGKPLTDETASKAADLLLKDAKPLAQNGYKIPLAHTLIRRTLLALNS